MILTLEPTPTSTIEVSAQMVDAGPTQTKPNDWYLDVELLDCEGISRLRALEWIRENRMVIQAAYKERIAYDKLP